MKSSTLKILIIGPFLSPLPGNSISNKVAYEGLSGKPGIKASKINTSTSFFDERVGFFSIQKLLNSIRFNLQVYKIISSDVVYITPGQSFLGIVKYAILIFATKLLNRKLVLHIHGNYLRQEYQNINSFKKSIAKFILGQADKGIVLSDLLIPNLTPFMPENKINIVHNFVEDFLFEDTQETINRKKLNKLRIIYLSNLMLEKGILEFLETLKNLERKGINYEAKIAGNMDTNTRDVIKKYFDEIKNFSYLGVVDGESKKEMLLWANVFVFPSFYKMEGQPIAILEAMATGNIVLTSNHAGIPDVFSLDNGLFIDPKNPSDIVRQIINILKHKEKFERIMRHNHQYARSNFRDKKFIDSLESILKPF